MQVFADGAETHLRICQVRGHEFSGFRYTSSGVNSKFWSAKKDVERKFIERVAPFT